MLEYEERYGPPDIARRVADVGQRITSDYPDGHLLLIAILKGAGVFMADLARTIPRALRLEYIDVIRGGNEEEIVDFQFVTSFPVKGMDLIVLKDVIRSGVIETWLMNHLREEGPRSIRFASLVDRPQERKSSLYVDYVLFPSEEGVLVGYGMEYKGEGGNLPFIAQVRTPGDPPFAAGHTNPS
jgi:hypoxanthine phosphoribosyltransferase